MNRIIIFFILCLLPVVSAMAVRVTSLYQVELPVASQSENSKSRAAKAGLIQVLIKLSGDQDLIKNPIIKAAINKADYYIQEYSYSTATMDSSHFFIQIQYNPNDINQLLKKSGHCLLG